MACKVSFSSAAARDLKKAPREVQEEVAEIIEAFPLETFCERVRTVKGYESCFRFRLGLWRMIFKKTETEIIILVLALRREAYQILKQRIS